MANLHAFAYRIWSNACIYYIWRFYYIYLFLEIISTYDVRLIIIFYHQVKTPIGFNLDEN